MNEGAAPPGNLTARMVLLQIVEMVVGDPIDIEYLMCEGDPADLGEDLRRGWTDSGAEV